VPEPRAAPESLFYTIRIPKLTQRTAIMSTKIKFLSIIAENPGIPKEELRGHFELSRNRYSVILAHLIKAELIRSIPEPGFERTTPYIAENPSYAIKRRGRGVLRAEYEARTPSDRRKTKPDYPRIRKILNAPSYASNAELADMWNELTDFYLPYGNEELKPIY
jgi:hypothetical protein